MAGSLPTLEVDLNAVEKWIEGYGKYHEAYERLKEYLEKRPEIPKRHYILYRAFLFKAMKRIPEGADPAKLIEVFTAKTGVDPNVCRDILVHFGLA